MWMQEYISSVASRCLSSGFQSIDELRRYRADLAEAYTGLLRVPDSRLSAMVILADNLLKSPIPISYPASNADFVRGMAASRVLADRYGNNYVLNMLGHEEPTNPLKWLGTLFTGIPPKKGSHVAYLPN